MISFMEKKESKLARKLISCFVAVTFVFTVVVPPNTFAQVSPPQVLNLPMPGAMVNPTMGFNPALIKGITFHPENPMMFNFIVHPGDNALEGKAFEEESAKLVRYFLAALTIPEEKMWVNLSPYEKDRIIPQSLSETELGQVLLTQDYMLKQLTASLMYPENELGSDFWNRVYSKAEEKYGTTEVPMDTFNKIWIIPQEAVLYENEKSVFVVESKLKVLLEEDYLALEKNQGNTEHGLGDVTKADLKSIDNVSTAVIRDILIPEIEKEVNQGETFAQLRQIFNSIILAKWYKTNLQNSFLSQIYVNKDAVEGINIADKNVKKKVYDQYIKAFEKGVFDFIKDEYNPQTQELVPRKYFSGGVLASVENAKMRTDDSEVSLAMVYDGLDGAKDHFFVQTIHLLIHYLPKN